MEKEKLKDPRAMLAVVRIRGMPGAGRQVNDTLRILRLTRPNHCALVYNSPSNLGMLKKAQHMLTWGEIDKSTLEKLVFKRARLPGNKRLEKKQAEEISAKILRGEKVKEAKHVFRLNPPSKGYKPTKKLYPRGAAGYRGKKINELLKRMI